MRVSVGVSVGVSAGALQGRGEEDKSETEQRANDNQDDVRTNLSVLP